MTYGVRRSSSVALDTHEYSQMRLRATTVRAKNNLSSGRYHVSSYGPVYPRPFGCTVAKLNVYRITYTCENTYDARIMI